MSSIKIEFITLRNVACSFRQRRESGNQKDELKTAFLVHSIRKVFFYDRIFHLSKSLVCQNNNRNEEKYAFTFDNSQKLKKTGASESEHAWQKMLRNQANQLFISNFHWFSFLLLLLFPFFGQKIQVKFLLDVRKNVSESNIVISIFFYLFVCSFVLFCLFCFQLFKTFPCKAIILFDLHKKIER